MSPEADSLIVFSRLQTVCFGVNQKTLFVALLWFGSVPHGKMSSKTLFVNRCYVGLSPPSDDCDTQVQGKSFFQGKPTFTNISINCVWCPNMIHTAPPAVRSDRVETPNEAFDGLIWKRTNKPRGLGLIWINWLDPQSSASSHTASPNKLSRGVNCFRL